MTAGMLRGGQTGMQIAGCVMLHITYLSLHLTSALCPIAVRNLALFRHMLPHRCRDRSLRQQEAAAQQLATAKRYYLQSTAAEASALSPVPALAVFSWMPDWTALGHAPTAAHNACSMGAALV